MPLIQIILTFIFPNFFSSKQAVIHGLDLCWYFKESNQYYNSIIHVSDLILGREDRSCE